MAELADALHSGCSARQGVEVRVLSSAPDIKKPQQISGFLKGTKSLLLLPFFERDLLKTTRNFQY